MIERDLYEHYRFNKPQFVKYRGYNAFYENRDLYVIVPVSLIETEELLEIKHMSDYLQFQQEERVATFVPTIRQELMATLKEEKVVLFKIIQASRRTYVNDGADLGRFHRKGRFYPYQPRLATRIGQWKSLWEQRLDQLEHWWSKKVQERPTNRFEKHFIETFPYFLGLSENAIQYIADCLWEDRQNEAQQGTICQLKYKPQRDIDHIIFPTELVYDHPTRDLAEWIRTKFNEGTSMKEIIDFLNEYEKIMPLSAISWRMLFGRLLFPLSYFEAVEGYYSTTSESLKNQYESRFFRNLEKVEEYELFVGSFFEKIGLPVGRLKIPEIKWLTRVQL